MIKLERSFIRKTNIKTAKMRNKNGIILFCIFVLVSYIDGFEVNLDNCKIKCPECPKKEEQKGEEKPKIPGFYWRDYRETIPKDAVPLGKPDQQPRTFIGYVFDPEFDGMFSATIVEGRDYVYIAHNGTVHKRSKVIQILCSQELRKLKWVHLEDQKLSNEVLVTGGRFEVDGRLRSAYLARAKESGEYSAGDILTRKQTMEFATLDGLSKTNDYFEILYYVPNGDNSSEKQEEQKEEDKNQCSNSEFEMSSCELVCNDSKKSCPDPTMYYYWKNTRFFSKSEAFVAGHDSSNKSSYIGRDYLKEIGLDVGYSPDGKKLSLFWKGSSIETSGNGKFLSTTTPEKLKWISTNADEFRTMDKCKIIKAGMFHNESITYIGRVLDGKVLSPASVRVYDDSVWALFYHWGAHASSTFDVLSYVD